MNFKEWLTIAEAGGTTRTRPTQQTVTDRGSLYGLSAQFGHRGTQMPLSAGINNQAVSGLAAGIGSGVNKALADSGFEPSPVPQISQLPTIDKPLLEKGILPLQLPLILSPTRQELPGFKISDSLQSYDMDIHKQVYKQVSDPDNDVRVRKINDDPQDRTKFATLQQMKGPQETQNLLGLAKNFTRALIKISVILKMREKGLDKKYDLSKGRLGKEQENNGNLISVFYFEPYKTVDQEEVKE